MATKESVYRYYVDEACVTFAEGDDSRRQALMNERKYCTINGQVYFCFINSTTQEEEWFYCPKSSKVTLATKDGTFECEYMCLGYDESYKLNHKGKGVGYFVLSRKGTVPMELQGDCFLDEFGLMNPFIISSKGFNETDVVCLYRVDMNNLKEGNPKIDYKEPYLAHVSEEIATPVNLEYYYCAGHGCQISDDGKYFRNGVTDFVIKNPENYRFYEYEINGLEMTQHEASRPDRKKLSRYSTRDLVAEREAERIKAQEEKERIEREEEEKKNNKKTTIENDPKLETMRKNFPRKQMKGQPEFFLIENPVTKEEKWYYCPPATLIERRNSENDSFSRHVSLGCASPELMVDDGKVIISPETYSSTDIVMVYEVELAKDKKPKINRRKYYILHLDTLDMVECSGTSVAHISRDGESMKVRNPFAPNTRYDLLSTRNDEIIDTYVSAPLD